MEPPTYNEDEESAPAANPDLDVDSVRASSLPKVPTTKRTKKGKRKRREAIDTESDSEDIAQKNPTNIIAGNEGNRYARITPVGSCIPADLDRGSMTPLRHFLESSMLSTDTQTAEDEASKPVRE